MATAIMPSARAERSGGAASARLAFRFAGSALALDVADEAALQLISFSYGPLLARAPEGVRTQASVRRLSDGRLHVRYGRQAIRPANAADSVPLRAAYHAGREIFARFACEPAQCLAIYGALCAVDGGAALLLGPTSIGKTLLALHAAHRGARFLGDETVLLDLVRDEAFAMPRLPSLRESALPLLPEKLRQGVASSPNAFQSERGRFWYALGAEALGGVEPDPKPYPLRAVCVIRAREERAGIQRLDAAEAARLVAQRAYARPTSLAQTSALRRAMRRAAFLEITLGTPEESSELLLRELRACG